jgi:hypothetical protein
VPKAEQQLEEWQTAVENLINAAEVGGGWLMLARIGVMRALNRNVERVFESVAQKKIIRNPETARQCLTAAAIKS